MDGIHPAFDHPPYHSYRTGQASTAGLSFKPEAMQTVRRIAQNPVLTFSYHPVRSPFGIFAPILKHSHIKSSLQIQPRAFRPVSACMTFASMTQTSNGTPEANWVGHRSDPQIPTSGPGDDWVNPVVDRYLQEVIHFRPAGSQFTHLPRVLVLYGTLRPKGFSKLLAFECARILEALGAEVRTYDPHGLPVREPDLQDHPKVVELRELVYWSEAHVWVASELHGNLCSTFKNQIDWIPLNSGSVRPTQGKSVAVLQVCGGSQSFNVVNTLRLLARWMRMACVVNQSSVQKAWKEFDDHGRMKESAMRDRVVDVMEEFIKFARINREYSSLLTNRYSERKEKEEKGRLLTQAEKEGAADAAREEARKEKANE